MCENTAQAKSFIDSLPGLTCNKHTEKLLDDLFAGRKDFYGEEIKSLATTGCGKSRIRIYEPLGDTLEEHQEEYTRREKEKHLKLERQRTEQMMERSKENKEKMSQMLKPNKGFYRTELVIWYYDIDPATKLFPSCATEETAHFETYAESAAEAYLKSVENVINTHDVVDYITMTDNRFKYSFEEAKTKGI